MATEQTLVSAEELLDLPDEGCRYELLDGELVALTPPGGEHGDIQITLGALLRDHVRDRGLGRVMGEVGVLLRRAPDRVRAPDLCFVAGDRLPTGRPPQATWKSCRI